MENENIVPEAVHLKMLKIKSIKKLENKENVYCLKATNNGNMIANGFIIKNCDALRYAIASHKVPVYDPYKSGHDPDEYLKNRFSPGGRKF